MAEPPTTPPSSDIGGVDRDAYKSRARGKPAVAGQQAKLAGAREDSAGRPDADPEIAPEENSQ